MRQPPSRSRDAAERPAGLATLLLLALLAWQSLALQAHVHLAALPRTPAPHATLAGAPQAIAPLAPAGDPATCPLCRQAAHAGTSLLPTVFSLAAPVAVRPVARGLRLPRWPARHAPHGWYGRAPPAFGAPTD